MQSPDKINALNYLDSIYSDLRLSDAASRRQPLNSSMKELNDAGKDCSNCSGLCCTYAHNSMLITPLEALELYCYLQRKDRLNEDLFSKLNSNIKEFRLDKDLVIGRGREFRRNYTCPFYKDQSLGCSISPKHKPYGCLGFNSTVPGVNKAGFCKVYEDAHLEREQKFSDLESQANAKVMKDLNLYWDKKSIPVALIELIKKLN